MSAQEKIMLTFYKLSDARPGESIEDLMLMARRLVAMCEREARS